LRIWIVGATVRAAAHSALRAGWQPVGADLFADRDLAEVCETHLVPKRLYPSGFINLSARVAASPWLYTGALENHPSLVDRLAEHRPLWGNPGATLRAARDPIHVAEVLSRAGLPVPAVRLDPPPIPRDGRWLVKPLASAGGKGIAPFVSETRLPEGASYYQERIEGTPLAAVFLGECFGAALLGVTWQWVGRPGAPFAYRGSIGPLLLATEERRQIAELGRVVASSFGLLGIFGIDLILRDGQPWAVEINPRYTASIEVLEMALGRSMLAEHGRVFDPDVPIAPEARNRVPAPRRGLIGKAILFGERSFIFDKDIDAPRKGRDWFDLPKLADVPHPGARFEPGEPVLTVFARGTSIASCRARLERQLAAWKKRLGC
jgi:predicted ATP-grasp superfamily ATP-dependent carboligase